MRVFLAGAAAAAAAADDDDDDDARLRWDTDACVAGSLHKGHRLPLPPRIEVCAQKVAAPSTSFAL